MLKIETTNAREIPIINTTVFEEYMGTYLPLQLSSE